MGIPAGTGIGLEGLCPSLCNFRVGSPGNRFPGRSGFKSSVPVSFTFA
uniref:Uncharacterized protein n=1 Tax=Arundo donax TaxID=35708 RepID=A0A0A8ZMR7_ARUDO